MSLPKPNIHIPLVKGTVIELTAEQIALLTKAGISRHIYFIVGSPINDAPLTKEYPRQETPHRQSKRNFSQRARGSLKLVNLSSKFSKQNGK